MTVTDYLGITWQLPDPELLPCPFCGVKPEVVENMPSSDYYHLDNCWLAHHIGRVTRVYHDSTKPWNTRHTIDRNMYSLIQALKGLEDGRGN